nr:hypothetical protein [Tanacetum cinerariifolium]
MAFIGYYDYGVTQLGLKLFIGMIPQLVIILEGEMCTSVSRVPVWEGAEEVQSTIHIKAEKCKKMKLSQDMQLIQKLHDDQKRNIVTNSRMTPSWREILSLAFSEAGILHVNWTSLGHCISRRGHLCKL